MFEGKQTEATQRKWRERLAIFPFLVAVEQQLQVIAKRIDLKDHKVYKIFAVGSQGGTYVEMQKTHLNAMSKFHLHGREPLQPDALLPVDKSMQMTISDKDHVGMEPLGERQEGNWVNQNLEYFCTEEAQ